MTRFLLLGYVATVLWSCADDEVFVSPEKSSTSYLPLEVGNYWEFKPLDVAMEDVLLHREVVGMADINGHEYYLITSRYVETEGRSPGYVDSTYYRVQSNGDVYTYRKGMAIEELRYKLLAADGDGWSYPFIDGQMHVTVNVGTVQTELNTVDGCKHYYFDVEQWADEEHTNSLAPGVGFIREYSNAWGLGMILIKASIGGSVTAF